MIVPVVTLSNGIRIANFSSPHAFTFTDGTVLPACDPERSRQMSLHCHEVEKRGIAGSIDIKISWELTDEVRTAILELEKRDDIDIVLVPLPVLQCIRADKRHILCIKPRVVRMADRVKKIIHIDRFCV